MPYIPLPTSTLDFMKLNVEKIWGKRPNTKDPHPRELSLCLRCHFPALICKIECNKVRLIVSHFRLRGNSGVYC